MYRINGHGHLLPYPEQIPAFMKEKKLFWIDKDRKFMRQGDWKRPVTDPSFFLDEKLEWMDRNKIDHEVILNLSQLYCNGMEKGIARDVMRFQNDFNAETQQGHPDKFTCGFVVQPSCLENALTEIERCATELKLQLLCLPTHFLNDQEEWVSIADESLSPIFELANEHGLALEIHPYDGQRMIGLKDRFWRFHLVWMCAQTADTYHFFTLLDFPNKYPNIRTCFAHGNQFGQVNVGRRIQGFEGRPDLFKEAKHPNESLGAKNVFFDTIVHDIYSFRLLVERQGVSQIVAGLDDPYPLGEMETVPNSYPGRVIEEAVAEGIITDAARKEIWLDNVIEWLAGKNAEQMKKRLGLP
jgi:aminocarboxymuconate-semialdehyde decarboxylase